MVDLYVYDTPAKLVTDQVDVEKGRYRALVATLDVVNANHRMLASGILGTDTSTVFVSDWNHSAGRGDIPPVAKASLAEQDSAIYASFQHDIENERSMDSFRRNMFFKDELQFSLGYRVKEYSINYEEEYIKVLEADFREVTPAVMGASPNTKVVDKGKDLAFDVWFASEVGKGKSKDEEEVKTEIDFDNVSTLNLVNALRKRKFDFSIFTV